MGIIESSDNLVKNSIQLLDDALNSKFTSYLDGVGKPILVKYWNINDTLSTVGSGFDNIDKYLGSESPIRYNYIENLPIYCKTSEWIPEIEIEQEGLLDLGIDSELIIFPNSIRPTPGDYFIYEYHGRNITFLVNNISLGTLKNNDFYKLNVNLKEIDTDSYKNKLMKQTVQDFKAVLENIGTNEKCLIESTTFDKIERVKKILKNITSDYIDEFFVGRYNSLVLYNSPLGGYPIYDQYLTEFVINTNVLELSDNYFVLVNYDNQDRFRKLYNSTLYRNIELKTKKNLSKMRCTPIKLTNPNTNPFDYRGEEIVFCLNLYEDIEFIDPQNMYIDYKLIDDINCNNITSHTSIIRDIIIKYLNNETLYDKISDDEINTLGIMNIQHDVEHFRLIPIVLYIMLQYIKELKDLS